MAIQSTLTGEQAANAPLTVHRTALPALTGIRFFAAIQVVMFHFGAGFAQRHRLPWPVPEVLANGWIAVTLFFMLSGFILSYTYTGQIERPGGKKRFWEARFARIYPVYLLSLLLSWPFRGTPGPGLVAATFAMVQAWNPFHVEYAAAINMPAWTLSTEAFFYLVFPFLLPLVEKLSTRMLQVLTVVTLLVITFGHTMTHAIEWLAPITFLPLPVFRFPEFLVGILTGLIFLRTPSQRNSQWGLYLALAAIFAILIFAKDDWLSLSAIPFCLLIYSLASGKSWLAMLIGSKPFLLLGGASYSIYLLQEPVRFWMHLAFTGSHDLNIGKNGMDTFLSPVVLLLLAIVVYLFWEEPARKWLRSWFKRHTTAR